VSLLRLIICLLLGLCPLTDAAASDELWSDGSLAQRLDDLVSEMVSWSGATPAYSIAIDQGGEIVYEKHLGFADIGNRVPASRETTFKIGSISKSYTALAVLQLVEQGKVDLDAAVSRYLPDLAGPAAGATIRELLTHTSGIPNYTDLSETRPLLEWSEPTRDEIVALFQDEALEFVPGTRYSYSNSGYYLLGLVIESVSGKDYFDHLESGILVPLGLNATYSGDYADIVSNQARGYVATPEGFENAAPTSHLAPFSAGMLEASAADVARYRRGVFTSPEISAKLRDLVTKTGRFSDGTDHFYSLGALVISDFHGHRRFEHNGGITGFVSEHVYFPNHDLTIVVLVNANGAPVSPDALAASLSRKILGVAEPDATEVEVPEQLLESYAGLYPMKPLWLAGEFKRVVLEDGSLLLQLDPDGEQPTQIPLLPRTDREFALAIDEGIRIRFVVEQGQVRGLEVLSEGRVSPAQRIADTHTLFVTPH